MYSQHQPADAHAADQSHTADMYAGQGSHQGAGMYAGMSQFVEEFSNGGSGLSSLGKLLNLDDSEFWKGALIQCCGSAPAYQRVCAEPAVQNRRQGLRIPYKVGSRRSRRQCKMSPRRHRSDNGNESIPYPIAYYPPPGSPTQATSGTTCAAVLQLATIGAVVGASAAAGANIRRVQRDEITAASALVDTGWGRGDRGGGKCHCRSHRDSSLE